MTSILQQVDLAGLDAAYRTDLAQGRAGLVYDGPVSAHLAHGDRRLRHLRFDPAPASRSLWNFLLSEGARLAAARRDGRRLVAAIKDLGPIPVLAGALPHVLPFALDGAWWIPCLMEQSDGLLQQADALGVDASFCPVRAMLGVYLPPPPGAVATCHYPPPDLITCSAGAICDDVSAIVQRLQGLGLPVAWWEMPRRRAPDAGEEGVALPGGLWAARSQVDLVASELRRLASVIATPATGPLDEARLAASIHAANAIRGRIRRLRQLVFDAPQPPLPALEMLIVEMLAIHFCSDRSACAQVLDDLVALVHQRLAAGVGSVAPDAVRVLWINPVADLRAMSVIEELGGRVCASDFLFTHSLEDIAEDAPPFTALAANALADPMVGSCAERAALVVDQARRHRIEAAVVSRIPGASHCAYEGSRIAAALGSALDIPTVEIEVPVMSDSLDPALRTRIEALLETVRGRRGRRRHEDRR